MRRFLWSLLFGLLAACGSARDAKTQLSLTERQFLLQSQVAAPLMQGVDVRVSFSLREVSFMAGCNQHFGDYTLRDQKIVMRGMGHTEMGCGSEEHARDTWLEKFFQAGPRLTLADHTLTLQNGAAKLVFLDRVVADPDRPLQQTPWTVAEYIDGETMMGLMNIEGPQLTFARDGSFKLQAVCVDAEGRYTLDGKRITITGISFTPHPCQEENDQVAARFVRNVLSDGEFEYRIKAGHLTLEGNKHGLGLRDLRSR